MTTSLQRLTAEPGLDRLISDFFQRSVGEWRSERRYFTLPDGKVLSMNDQINNHSFVQGTSIAGEISIAVKGVNVPMGKAGKQPFALVASVQ